MELWQLSRAPSDLTASVGSVVGSDFCPEEYEGVMRYSQFLCGSRCQNVLEEYLVNLPITEEVKKPYPSAVVHLFT